MYIYNINNQNIFLLGERKLSGNPGPWIPVLNAGPLGNSTFLGLFLHLKKLDLIQ